MFAIVDIETTGSHATENGITEICILLHNGVEEEGRFHTLINPQKPIPRYISALTGINSFMLADAPLFSDVADKIYQLLQGRIFVAHNVNFDFSFINHHLLQCGFTLHAKKLCTVRYSRKVMPGHKSYSLGNICEDLNITNNNRHRAHGDAEATAQLLMQMMALDEGQKILQQMTKGRNAEGYLPMHVPVEQLHNLPYGPGVYYFKNQVGKIIYVGKAVNIRYRVRSHFSNNAANLRKQDFIRNIHSIAYQACVSELHALVLEAIEIKRIWPMYNRSQKRFEQQFGLYHFQDQNGLIRLAVEKKRKHLPALYTFHRRDEGMVVAKKMLANFNLNEQISFASTTAPKLKKNEINNHNKNMKEAMDYLQNHLPSFVVLQPGEDEKGQPKIICFLVEKGRFAGMKVLGEMPIFKTVADCKSIVQPCPDYDFVRQTLITHAERNPKEIIFF